MKIKWLSEARNELRELVRYYRVLVIPTNEELMIAMDTAAIVKG